MADEEIRIAEREAAQGGLEEANALKVLQLRADPLKPTEFRNVIDAPFCSKCGEKASHTEMSALVGFAWVHHPSYDKENWRKTVDGETPNFVNPGWSRTIAGNINLFEVSEERLRSSDESKIELTVVCENSHRWTANMKSVWLEPLLEEEEAAREA